MTLGRKIESALAWTQKAKAQSTRQLLAFSGGKDSIVVAHLAAQLGIRDAVCETSFYFAKQTENIKEIAAHLGLNVTWACKLSRDWLRRNPEVIFADDTKLRAWTFAVRQQKTVKQHARMYGYDCQIFGRRTQENSVRAHLYRTSAGLQCHPIRDWSEGEVWQYLRDNRIPEPWIYSTPFGQKEGNAPFYAMCASDFGGVENCWALAAQLDPKFSRKEILGY